MTPFTFLIKESWQNSVCCTLSSDVMIRHVCYILASFKNFSQIVWNLIQYFILKKNNHIIFSKNGWKYSKICERKKEKIFFKCTKILYEMFLIKISLWKISFKGSTNLKLKVAFKRLMQPNITENNSLLKIVPNNFRILFSNAFVKTRIPLFQNLRTAL